MLKYRSLTQDELKSLETEFKHFLIINELHDGEWSALATNDPEKAQGFIDLFSNIVLEKVYQKAAGLFQVGTDFVSVFHLENPTWKVYHFTTKAHGLLEGLNAENFIQIILEHTTSFELHVGSKESSEQKASAVHELICKGANILDRAILQEFLQQFQVN